MTEREALKLALEALEDYAKAFENQGIPRAKKEIELLTAIKETLEQQKQKHVVWCEQSDIDWLNSDKRGASAYVKTMLSSRKDGLAQIPLYTTPPWVGLTDEEIDDIYMGAGKHDLIRARAIEAKLRSKNT